MAWYTEKNTTKLGRLILPKNKIKMHEYTIFNGKLIGDFEGLYRSFKDPFTQSKKEKFETSKAAIINYCNLLQEKQKKKLITLEIGCGFGQLTEKLAKLGFKAFGTDISETAIKKAKARSQKNQKNFFTSKFSNYSLYTKINPDIIILSEITWYVLPELKSFIKFIKKKFKNKYLIHSLAIYYPGQQKYGKEYFTNNNEILKFFNLKYIEWGEKWNKEEGRTFFLAEI
jgi:2-polyprenyl-3-methyl-5-hydroxy-6-metoxy-1,4-benzoquinol methylase